MLLESAELLPPVEITIPRPVLPGPYWNDENVAMVKRLWAEGLSSSEIAARMGISRNAVIGKISRLRENRPIHKSRKEWPEEAAAALRKMWNSHSVREIMDVIPYSRSSIIAKAARMGMTPRAKIPPRHREQRAKPRRRSVAARRIVGISCKQFDAAIPRERIKGLMDRQPGKCCWPIGDPREPGFGFCCAVTDGVQSYCADHLFFLTDKKPERRQINKGFSRMSAMVAIGR